MTVLTKRRAEEEDEEEEVYIQNCFSRARDTDDFRQKKIDEKNRFQTQTTLARASPAVAVDRVVAGWGNKQAHPSPTVSVVLWV